MAVISAVFGGIAGFVTFFSALIFSDITIAQAFLLYIAAGICTTIGLLTVCTTALWFKARLIPATATARGTTPADMDAQTAS